MQMLNLITLGIFGSLVATSIMTLYEIPFWRKWGIKGVFEWHENQILSTRFFGISRRVIPYRGIFCLHFLNGTLGGLLFPFVIAYLVNPHSIMFVALSGIVYGCFLWIITLVPIHKPITGLAVWNHHPLGHHPALVSLGGHVVYGIVLGIMIATFL
jgi:hypothetical protein